MWILGLKGLIANNLKFTVWLHCDSIIPFVCIYIFVNGQGCALTEPGSPWHLTFAIG